MIIIISCFILLVLAISAANLTISSNLTLTDSLPSNSALNLSAGWSISCMPRAYGANLRPESCINAWQKIERTEHSDYYYSRGQSGPGVSVPIRWQSDDGLCVIDLRPRFNDHVTIGEDVSRGVDISDAVRRMIARCMIESASKSGGSTNGFSTSLALASA